MIVKHLQAIILACFLSRLRVRVSFLVLIRLRFSTTEFFFLDLIPVYSATFPPFPQLSHFPDFEHQLCAQFLLSISPFPKVFF
jgi:hypothetical protein